MSKSLCKIHCQAWNNAISSDVCSARSKLTEALQTHFGYSTFRLGQLESLLPVAHGQDTFVRLPTGGGKSLCMFLLPLSMGSNAMGIIISPLVGLIEQQVREI